MFLQKIQHYLVRKVNDESSLLFDKEAVSSAPEKARKKKKTVGYLLLGHYIKILQKQKP